GMGTICLVDNGVFGSVIPQTGNLCREWRRATLGTVLSQHAFVRIGVIHDYAHMERLGLDVEIKILYGYGLVHAHVAGHVLVGDFADFDPRFWRGRSWNGGDRCAAGLITKRCQSQAIFISRLCIANMGLCLLKLRLAQFYDGTQSKLVAGL